MTFKDEEGLGEGPVKEFFTILSQAIQEDKRIFILNKNEYNLNLKDIELIKDKKEKEEIEERCKVIGRLIGKAIVDNRFIDLALSELSWAMILGVSLHKLSVSFFY